MKKDKYICGMVKAPWFIDGEYRKTIPMDKDFVSEIQTGDEMSMYLILYNFAPYEQAVRFLTDEAKVKLHDSAKQTIEYNPEVEYTSALKSAYVDWLSKQRWHVTKRRWNLDLGTYIPFLEITIEVQEDK